MMYNSGKNPLYVRCILSYIVELDDGQSEEFLIQSPCNETVQSNSDSVIQLALIHGHVNACKFLLDAGADPYLEVTLSGWLVMDNLCLVSLNNIRFLMFRSAFDYAWTYVLQASGDEGFLRALQNLFLIINDYLEKRQLFKLYKIVFGIILHDLKVELAISRLDIDRRDSLGFILFIWAVWKDDYMMVKFLFKAKANLNIYNFNSSLALTLVAQSSFVSVKLLLEAGVDPTYSDNRGYNALHFAAED